MSEDVISQREREHFLKWREEQRKNGITTWTVVEGTPEEKVQAMFGSTAFWIDYGNYTTTCHSFKVQGDTISYIDPESSEDEDESDERDSMSREEAVRELVRLDNPEVQVCYPVTS